MKWSKAKQQKHDSVESISNQENVLGNPKAVFILFGLLFVVAGCGFSYLFLIKPTLRVIDAKNWVTTGAVVEHSQVKHHSSSDGTTYSVDVLFAYEFDNEHYKSNQYSFFGGSSSGYDGKREVVSQYPVGKSIQVYVNPQDPSDAVIERGFTLTLLFGIIPLAFLLFGLALVYGPLRKKKTQKKSPLSSEAFDVRVSSESTYSKTWLTDVTKGHTKLPSGEVQLQPQVSPQKKLFAVLFFAAFWNGIVSVFIVQAVKDWQRGSPDWFLVLFLVPFELIGVAAIGYAGYCALALFNPRPTLVIGKDVLRLGESTPLRWTLSGRTGIVKDLQIWLKGVEEATYRRGTSTYTDRETFYKESILSVGRHGDVRGGSGSVSIPKNFMHSFASGNNKIVWTIEIHGEIAKWPDIKEEFEFLVLPQKTAN